MGQLIPFEREGKWGTRCERSCACAYCERERGTCVRTTGLLHYQKLCELLVRNGSINIDLFCGYSAVRPERMGRAAI